MISWVKDGWNKDNGLKIHFFGKFYLLFIQYLYNLYNIINTAFHFHDTSQNKKQ